MKVEVRLFATLAEAVLGARAGEPLSIELPEGATVTELIAVLNVDPSDVHLVMIDGRICHGPNVLLAAGSRIGLFPPVGGG